MNSDNKKAPPVAGLLCFRKKLLLLFLCGLLFRSFLCCHIVNSPPSFFSLFHYCSPSIGQALLLGTFLKQFTSNFKTKIESCEKLSRGRMRSRESFDEFEVSFRELE